jgi:hypothetical protein
MADAQPRTRRLHVDLADSNMPGARSVVYEGQWGCTDAQLRALAAAHCQVPLEQVGHPQTVPASPNRRPGTAGGARR